MSSTNWYSGSLAKEQIGRTYYQVLEISPDEKDPTVIEEAALRCAGQARVYQLTRETECTQQLNEIAEAMNVLLDPVQRNEYDLRLGKPAIPETSRVLPAVRSASPVLPRLSGGANLFHTGPGRSCDVRLVYRGPAL